MTKSQKNMEPILLVGVGSMGIEHVKVLKAMNIPVVAVGRGEKSAEHFEQATGIPVIRGGYDLWIKQPSLKLSCAIVSVGEKSLGQTVVDLIKHGARSILVEKPGGFNTGDIRKVAEAARTYKSEVFVAYNRRFFASVLKAKEFITHDGGVSSFYFEFTEWSDVISKIRKDDGVKEQWFLANSSHVVDLAFFLGGKPHELHSYTAGTLSWHPKAAVYTGAGRTVSGSLFAYHANWGSPGRWGVEIMTPKHRLILRPLEKLQIQRHGNMAIEEVILEDELDRTYKPGFYRQVTEFLGAKRDLLTIQEQVDLLRHYEAIDPP